MHDAFKSLTVSNIEILELDGPLLTVRVVAEAYAQLNIPQRVDVLIKQLRDTSKLISLNYAISFEPLTPVEFSEWYGNGKSDANSGPGNTGVAAKPADL
jgi:hypothetical protein